MKPAEILIEEWEQSGTYLGGKIQDCTQQELGGGTLWGCENHWSWNAEVHGRLWNCRGQVLKKHSGLKWRTGKATSINLNFESFVPNFVEGLCWDYITSLSFCLGHSGEIIDFRINIVVTSWVPLPLIKTYWFLITRSFSWRTFTNV